MKLFDVRTKTDGSNIDLSEYHCVLIKALHPVIQEEIRKYNDNACYAMLYTDHDTAIVFVNGNVPRWLYFE